MSAAYPDLVHTLVDRNDDPRFRWEDGSAWSEAERTEQASRFLRELYSAYEDQSLYADVRCLFPSWSEFAWLYEKSLYPTHLARRHFLPIGTAAQAASKIVRLAFLGDVYVGVLPHQGKCGKGDSVVEAAWLWCDVDCKGDFEGEPSEVALQFLYKRLTEAGLPAPNMVVESRNGCHVYWRLKNSVTIASLREREMFRRLLLRLVECIGGEYPGPKADLMPTNVNSILRVPGTLHRKKPGSNFPVQLTLAQYDNCLTVRDWTAILPVGGSEQARRGLESRDSGERRLPKRVLELMQNPPTEGGRHEALKTILAGACWAGFADDVLEEMTEAFSAASGLPRDEALRMARYYIRQSRLRPQEQ